MRVKIIAALLPVAVMLGSCSSVVSSTAQPDSQEVSQGGEMIASYKLELYADVLSTYVDDEGWVDYEGLQADRTKLDEFNASLNEVTPETFSSWPESEQIAFLVNAYNSLTLKSIIDQDPLKSSIRDIPGVWRIRRHPILNGAKTLDNIEHGVLREDYDEPRIHAALVCAARSCPPLRNEPYTGEILDEQLDDQVLTWLTSDIGLQVDQDSNTVSVSAIFDWFGEDWTKSYGVESGFTGSESQMSVLNFISGYVTEEEAAYLTDGNYTLKYIDYDWSLNSQS